MPSVSTNELYLLVLMIVFTVPFLVWRLGRTDYFAPLVVVQIITGILIGPAVLGEFIPSHYEMVFTDEVIQSLSGLALWAAMIFVWIAGVELDLEEAWRNRTETSMTAGLALGTPMLFGSIAAIFLLRFDGWIGDSGQAWQFVIATGMACAVSALPILILLMEKMRILRAPIGQRIVRYASLDDVAIWMVLAVILMDWQRISRQLIFISVFCVATLGFRWLMSRIRDDDRWYVAPIWVVLCGLGADWSGLHYMVGAFLAGVVIDRHWFDLDKLDALRRNVLLIMMPVYFLSTGLRTDWNAGGAAVVLVAVMLFVVQLLGKLAGIHIVGKILNWSHSESTIIAWMLQTKALIMIVFADILLDKEIISGDMFTSLLLMAVISTMVTIPVVTPRLRGSPALLSRGA